MRLRSGLVVRAGLRLHGQSIHPPGAPTLTEPDAGTYEVGDALSYAVTLPEDGQTTTAVAYYHDGDHRASALAAPWGVSRELDAGDVGVDVEVTARRRTAESGWSAPSAPVTITVEAPLVIDAPTLTSPGNGAEHLCEVENIPLTVSSVPDGVDGVRYYRSTSPSLTSPTLIAQVTSAPYSATWNPDEALSADGGATWHVYAVAYAGSTESEPSNVAEVSLHWADLVTAPFLANGSFDPTGLLFVGMDGTRSRIRGRVWGAGGGGYQAEASGGGGAFAQGDAPSTISSSVTITVPGDSGVRTAGGDASVGSFAVAKGGGAGAVGVAGAGGTASASTGSVKYSGGNGGTGGGNVAAGGGAGDEGDASGSTPGEATGGPGAANSGGWYGNGGGSQAGNEFSGRRGHAQIRYWRKATPGYRRCIGVSFGRDFSASTTRNVTPPAGKNGDDLVVVAGCDGNGTLSLADYTSLASDANGTTTRGAMFYRTADGSGAKTLTSSASVRVSWVCVRFRGPSAATASATANNGSSTNAQGPTHTPSGGSAARTWLSAVTWDTSAAMAMTGFPSGYSRGVLLQRRVASVGAHVMVMWRNATAASESPGATAAGNEQWVGITGSLQ